MGATLSDSGVTIRGTLSLTVCSYYKMVTDVRCTETAAGFSKRQALVASVVIFEAEVSNQVFAAQMPQSVL